MAVKNLRLKVTELGLYDGFMFGCLVGLAKDIPTGSERRYSESIRLWFQKTFLSDIWSQNSKSFPIVRWCSGWLINPKGR